jgi:spore germination protein
MNKYMKKSVVIAILVIAIFMLTVPMAFASGGNYHKVRYGDTLYSIGRYYGVSANAIAKANSLYNPNRIYAGQVLYIPSYGYDGCYDPCDDYYHDSSYGHSGKYHDGYLPKNHHKVARGETLSSIAYYYGVSPWEIAQANHIYNLNRIYAGQVLYIPGGGYYY